MNHDKSGHGLMNSIEEMTKITPVNFELISLTYPSMSVTNVWRTLLYVMNFQTEIKCYPYSFLLLFNCPSYGCVTYTCIIIQSTFTSLQKNVQNTLLPIQSFIFPPSPPPPLLPIKLHTKMGLVGWLYTQKKTDRKIRNKPQGSHPPKNE